MVYYANCVSGACNLVKKTCTNCRTGDSPCDRTYITTTQEECYTVVDGATNIMTEYKVHEEFESDCMIFPCYVTDIFYETDLVTTWMTSCVSGTPLFINVIIIPLHTYNNYIS